MAETTAAVDTVNLDDLTARAEYLQERRRALGDDLAAARARETTLIEELDALRRGRIEGSASDARLDKAEAGLASNRRTRQRVDEALAAVETELTQKRNAIDGLHRDRARARQTEAAKPLAEEAAAIEEAFIAIIASLPVFLHRRREVAARSGREFPLAPGIEAVRFDDLVRRVREVYEGPERDAVRTGPHHAATKQWLARLLSGPLTSSSSVGFALRDNGIVERE